MSNDVSSSLETLFGKMENFITTKTVVGDPVHIGDIILIPLVEVSFGVGAGAFGNADEKNKKESGAGGLGGHISPSAVLVIMNGNVQMVSVKNTDSLTKIIDMAPGIISKLNLGSIFSKKDQDKKTDTRSDEFFTEEPSE